MNLDGLLDGDDAGHSLAGLEVSQRSETMSQECVQCLGLFVEHVAHHRILVDLPLGCHRCYLT